jgi:hypothetical protein
MTTSYANLTIINAADNWQPWLTKFVDTYQQLSVDNLHLLATIYHSDVIFIDPLHQVQGFEELERYFQKLYANLLECRFQIKTVIANENQAAVTWQMDYQHPKLNQGNTVTVAGCSHLRAAAGKVIFHQDYLDVGAMLYEQVPVVGQVIRWLKTKATQ